MRTVLRVLLLAVAGLASVSAAFFAAGPDRVWTRLLGAPDQGAVAIATLTRRATPTDALACTPGICRAGADLVLPVYADSPSVLMERLDAIVLADRRNLTRVDDGLRPAYRRYVARTPIMQYPDTIDAEAFHASAGSALAIYGRSQIGTGDWGVNRARIEGWVRLLGGSGSGVPVAGGPPVS